MSDGESEENPVELDCCSPDDEIIEWSGENWNSCVLSKVLEHVDLGLPRKPNFESSSDNITAPPSA